MIIFGTRGVTRTRTAGTFHCPNCGPGITYRLQGVRRYFTLYFVPVLPLDALGVYVECDRCGATYRESVLSWDPAVDQRVEAEFHKAVRRTMVLMMLADGVIEAREIAMIREIHQKVAGADLTDDEVRAEADAARIEGTDIRRYLTSVLGHLNDNGKELVVKAAFYVAVADTELAPSERVLIREIGALLEMSQDRVDGILGDLEGEPA